MMFKLLLESFDALDSAMTAIISASLKAAPLVLIILLVQRLACKWLTPSGRYMMWSLVLLRLAVPNLPESRTSLYNLFAPAPRVEIQAPVMPGPLRATVVAPAAQAGHVSAAIGAATGKEGRDDDKENAAVQRRAGSIASMIQNGWLIGFLALGGWTAGTCFLFRWRLRASRRIDDERTLTLLAHCQRRIGVRRRVIVWEVKGLHSPALFGILRPKLLFPEHFIAAISDEALQTVLLHELVHLKRRDVWANWIMTCFQIIHWFNPLVWVAFARMRAARELACDARILACMSREEALTYGRTLLDLLERKSRVERFAGMAALVGIMERTADMKERLELIACGPVRRYRKGSLASLFLAGLLGFISLSNPALPSLTPEFKVKVPTRPEPALPAVPKGQTRIPLADARLLVQAIFFSEGRGPLDVATFLVNWPADKNRELKASLGRTSIALQIDTVEATTARPELGIRVSRSPYLRVVGYYQINSSSFGGGASGSGHFTFFDRQASVGGAMVNGQSLAVIATLLEKGDPLGEQSLGQLIRRHWKGCLEYQLAPFVRTEKALAPWKTVAGEPLTMPNRDLLKADTRREMDRVGWEDGGGVEFSREMLLDLDSGKHVEARDNDPWPAGFDLRWDPVIKEWWIRPDAKIHALSLGTATGDLFAHLDQANRLLGRLDMEGPPDQTDAGTRSPIKAPLLIRTGQGNVFCIERGGSGTSGGITGIKTYNRFIWYRYVGSQQK